MYLVLECSYSSLEVSELLVDLFKDHMWLILIQLINISREMFPQHHITTHNDFPKLFEISIRSRYIK